MLRILELKGKDSPDFLHRVTAGSVRGLNPQEGRAGIFLNGQSRVLAQFEVLRLSQDQFLLAVPDECAEELRAGLEALHFSEALEIVWREGSAEAIPGNSRAVDAVFSFSMNEGFCRWPSPVPGFSFEWRRSDSVNPHVLNGFHFARIGVLIPWPGLDWKAGETPALEAGFLPWIDRNKGCYPGQEVVELSLNVGHPARVLVAVEAEEKIETPEGFMLTSSAQENGRWRALIRVPWGKKEDLPKGMWRLASHF